MMPTLLIGDFILVEEILLFWVGKSAENPD